MPPHSKPRSIPHVVLVFPRFRYASGDFPIGIALLAAYIRRELEWSVQIYDSTFLPDLNRIQQYLEREQPDYVGVGMSTLMLGEGLEVCRIAKKLGSRVFVGGPHPTTNPDKMMEEESIDAVVIGEGEQITVELLKMWQQQVCVPIAGAHIRNPDTGEVWSSNERQPVEDLDTLPFPAWDLIDMEAYFDAWGQLDSVAPGLRGVNITASRGCPFSCTFCQPVLDKIFGRKLRQRTPGSVVAELRMLKQLYDIEAYWFTDDTFTTNRRWVEAFCDAMEESGLELIFGCTTRANLIPEDMMQRLVGVGLRKIGIGLESATDHIREVLYQKGVSDDAVVETVHLAEKYGVQVLLFLMLGAPDESRRDMLDTIRLAASLPASEASFSLFVPIPGTAVYEKMQTDGVEMSQNYLDYDYYARQPFEHQLSRFELRMWQRLAYLRFYGSRKRLSMLKDLMNDDRGRRSLGRKMMRIVPDFFSNSKKSDTIINAPFPFAGG